MKRKGERCVMIIYRYEVLRNLERQSYILFSTMFYSVSGSYAIVVHDKYYYLLKKWNFFLFQHYRDVTLVSRDGLTIVLTKTNQLIFEKWLKLLDSTRSQVCCDKIFSARKIKAGKRILIFKKCDCKFSTLALIVFRLSGYARS